MHVVGSGPPLVLIPGIQGRWQWMRAAVRALAGRFTVITFSLPGSFAGAAALRPLIDAQVEWVAAAMDRAGARRALVCGVSYGGLLALRLASRSPGRASGLVLVSTPGPGWRPDERARRYAGAPWRSAPAFFFGARDRLWTEIRAARPATGERWRTLATYLGDVIAHPPSPSAMARRVHALDGCDFAADARAVAVPTLVITGEPALDLVVPVAGTREYVRLIPGARAVTLENTGHIGLVTRAGAFADVIDRFAAEQGRS
jgi:3-oxoadipate enol-lactonase